MGTSEGATIDAGLSGGQSLDAEALGQFPFFAARKSNFADRLRDNLIHRVTGNPIRAAVLREYRHGEIICEAGSYGSTAFLLVEGSATAFLPAHVDAMPPQGRTARSLRRLASIFMRRTRSTRDMEVPASIGEVTAWGTLHPLAPPPPRTLGPGDVFGIDACVNFHPREITVRAETDCKVIEMLRSVLDTVRASGKSAAAVDDLHRLATIRNAIATQQIFAQLSAAQIDNLVAASDLATQDELTDGILYAEGTAADAVFIVATGTVRLSRKQPGGERILAYSGRGTMVGADALGERPRLERLVLRRVDQPQGPVVPLTGTVTIGRRRSATIPFAASDSSVSRRHCRFEAGEHDIRLIDENSDNGTFLNGRRVQEAIVSVGDRITLAEAYTFEVARESVEQPGFPRTVAATALDNCEIVRIQAKVVHEALAGSGVLEQLAAATTRPVPLSAASADGSDQSYLRRVEELSLFNSQNTLLIDLERCTRCDECVRACAAAHSGVPRFTRDGPRFGKYLVTLACRSCTDPKCMIGCPVASIRRTGSLEVHIEDWCVGCGLCANSCPFGNINMIDLATPSGAPLPDGPIDLSSGKLKATICDLCAGYDGPNCVYACPHDAAIRVNPTAFLATADLQVP